MINNGGKGMKKYFVSIAFADDYAALVEAENEKEAEDMVLDELRSEYGCVDIVDISVTEEEE